MKRVFFFFLVSRRRGDGEKRRVRVLFFTWRETNEGKNILFSLFSVDFVPCVSRGV